MVTTRERGTVLLPPGSSEDLDVLRITVGAEKVVVLLVRVQDPPVLRALDAVGGLTIFEFLDNFLILNYF